MRLLSLTAASSTALALAFAAGAGACDSTTTSATSPDSGPATGFDAGPSDDGSATARPDGAACTPKTGFETVAKLGDNGGRYAHVSMVLGADDQPRVVFIGYDLTDPNASALYFTKFDLKSCAWMKPAKVDTVENVNSNRPLREVVLVRDASTGTLGLAYPIESHVPAPNGDTHLMLALSKDDGATWTKEEIIHDPNAAQDNNVYAHAHPTVAMANGKMAYAYYSQYNLANSCGVASECNGWTLLTRTGESGAWTTAAVAAATGNPGGESLSGALAMDKDGNAGFAFLSRPAAASQTLLVNYVKAGATKAVAVFDSQSTQDDFPAVALTFEKSAPRLGVSLQRSVPPTGSSVWFTSSADGATWDAPSELPSDHGDGMGTYVSIANDGKAALTVAADFISGNGDSGVCGGPKLSTKTGAQPFTTCGADTDPAKPLGFAGDYVTVAYASNGKRVLAFDSPNPPTPSVAGIVVWREP